MIILNESPKVIWAKEDLIDQTGLKQATRWNQQYKDVFPKKLNSLILWI